jgi:hypothetical protein
MNFSHGAKAGLAFFVPTAAPRLAAGLHCNNSYRVFVMVPSCLHNYQLQFGVLIVYYIEFMSV